MVRSVVPPSSPSEFARLWAYLEKAIPNLHELCRKFSEETNASQTSNAPPTPSSTAATSNSTCASLEQVKTKKTTFTHSSHAVPIVSMARAVIPVSATCVSPAQPLNSAPIVSVQDSLEVIASDNDEMMLSDASANTAESEREDSDGFKTVGKRKRRLRKDKAATPVPQPPTKRATNVTTPVAASPAAASSQAMETEATPTTPREPKKPPPVIIQDKEAWNHLSRSLTSDRIHYTSARLIADGIKVTVSSSDDHRRLTHYLRSKSVGYHTYALEEDRLLRVVVKGVPKEYTIENVRDDLIHLNYEPLNVFRLYKRSTKEPYNTVLVILPLTPESKGIFNMKTMGGLTNLTVEIARKSNVLPQCHRCQLYGHSARNCFARPRCVKCLGDHGTIDCPRKDPVLEIEPPSCVLCRASGHTANYRGCCKAPKTRGKARNAAGRRRCPPKGGKNGPKGPTPDYPQFVPAPQPTTNPWGKAMSSPAAAPSAAVCASSAAVATPSAAPVKPQSPSYAAPTSSCGNFTIANFNWKEEFGIFRAKVQRDPNNASRYYLEHYDLLVAIDNFHSSNP